MLRIACVSLLALVGVMPLHCDALQRAFVASYGSDGNTANNCVLATPCRGFAAAMTVIDTGGEIVALDAAGYGAVVINRSVTITANPGFYAGIAASSGVAMLINGDGIVVTLRGLQINGIGGSDGVWMQVGASLTIENCVISNFTSSGLSVTGPSQVTVVNSAIRNNGSFGVFLTAGATVTLSKVKLLGNPTFGLYSEPVGGKVFMSLTDSVISGSQYAVGMRNQTRLDVTRSAISNNARGIGAFTSGVALVAITDTTLTGNQIALHVAGPDVVYSSGNNTFAHNGIDKFIDLDL